MPCPTPGSFWSWVLARVLIGEVQRSPNLLLAIKESVDKDRSPGRFLTPPMQKLRDSRGEEFIAGIVLYTGSDTKPLGDRLWAVPFSALWSG